MKYPVALFVICLLLPLFVCAQGVSINGFVIGAKDKKPIAYASVVLLRDGATPISGGSTDNKGAFVIHADAVPSGSGFCVRVEYLGFRPVVINNLFFGESSRNLGIIKLEEDALNLEAVVINYTPPPFSYKLDRKSIHAGSFPDANLAIDLLANIPSVRVDNEGRLTYRGEGTFLIYINGVLVANGADRLKQLPASQVETLDIITNPSSSYSADGNAGIIQVTLKKNRLEGYNIYSGITANTRGTINFAFSVDKKYKTNGWYVNGKIGQTIWEDFLSKGGQAIISDQGDNTVLRREDFRNKEFNTYLEGGFNLDLTKNDYLDISFFIDPSYTKKRNRGSGDFLEEEYRDNDQTGSLASSAQSRIDYDYQYYGTTLSYYHAFNPKKTHKLSLDLQYSGYLDELKEKRIDLRDYPTSMDRVGYQAYEKNRNRLFAKLNYAVPFNDRFSAEGGFDFNYDCIPETGSVNGTFDAQEIITPFDDEPLNQKVYFRQAIYSGYLTAKYEGAKVSVQLGARVEASSRVLNYTYDQQGLTQKESVEKKFTNFFPSLHFTYSPQENHQLSLSFSQRIRRPDYWNLIPLTQYITQYGYYRGNGELTPATTYIAELGYMRKFNKNFISGELFFRQTKNNFTNFDTPISEIMFLSQPQNVGQSTSAGVELMVGWDIAAYWNLNLSASVYLSWLDYAYKQTQTRSNRVKSDFRWNNTFKLPAKFSLKLDMYYYSALEGIQTRRDGYFVANIAVDKRFRNDRWRIGVCWYDVFFTNSYRTITQGTDFVVWDWYREKPYVSFRVGYYFSNQR